MIELIQLIAESTAIHSANSKVNISVQETFSMIDQRNLTYKHPVDAKSSLEAITSERFKRGRV